MHVYLMHSNSEGINTFHFMDYPFVMKAYLEKKHKKYIKV